jgi:hypothetical protein
MITATRKIGQNRGKPRLWIEGKLLVDAGLPHGTIWCFVPGETAVAKGETVIMSAEKQIEQLKATIKNLNFQLDVSPWAMGPHYREKIRQAEAELRQLEQQ